MTDSPVAEDWRDDAQYQDQRISGLRIEELHLKGATFTGCAFENCRFTATVLEHCAFDRCLFDRCDLSLTKFNGSTFLDSRFRRSKLLGIDWTVLGSGEVARSLMSLRFDECVLDLGNFYGIKLKELRIDRCSAIDARFAEADLGRAVLTRTDFRDAVFLHTNLEGADLRHSTNYAINPTSCNVRGARFTLPEVVTLLAPFGIEIEP